MERMSVWRGALPQGTEPDGLSNMAKWQSTWADPCTKLCCFSSHCASQPCSNCHQNTARHRENRMVCTECPISIDEDHQVDAYQLCQRCYDAASHLHQHALFCAIDGGTGQHTALTRVHVAPTEEYTAAMCPQVPAARAGDGLCGVCMCPFEYPDQPAVGWPGCCVSPPHPDARLDSTAPAGFSFNELEFYHSDCMAELLIRGKHEFCGDTPAPLCKPCLWLEHTRPQWYKDFKAGGDLLKKALEEAGGSIPVGSHDSAALELFAQVSAVGYVGYVGAEEFMPAEGEAGGDLNLEECVEIFRRVGKQMHPQPSIQAVLDPVSYTHLTLPTKRIV
eukprot:TRINITY_DN5247_c0_g1_i4.p1 TRINITY_DN5247_c0_g1~~TRINITY_DN5247_c0_g1_i4.p1  ORF type:complete len:334 (-),score=81.05 TRINITY_DN5247_c0_g1_i4:3-1004(-)